jgi:hypothetical protein
MENFRSELSNQERKAEKTRQFDLARKAGAVQDKLISANILILR